MKKRPTTWHQLILFVIVLLLIAAGAWISRAQAELVVVGMAIESPWNDNRSSITSSHPFIQKRYATEVAAETQWYDNKVFNLYLHNYLTKPYVFRRVEIVNIIDNTWVVFVTKENVTNYTPIYNINRLEELNI